MRRTIILASASPRRREILEQAGLSFQVVPSSVSEVTKEVEPQEIVKDLSRQKAEDVWKKLSGQEMKPALDSIVLAADTVVAKDGHILGKPKGRQEAFDMLTNLSASTHKVYTGVTLLSAEERQIFYEETSVEFVNMTPEQIWEYIETGEPFDKAGGYGIQSPRSAAFIKGIYGDFWNVVGLPIGEILRRLKTN